MAIIQKQHIKVIFDVVLEKKGKDMAHIGKRMLSQAKFTVLDGKVERKIFKVQYFVYKDKETQG